MPGRSGKLLVDRDKRGEGQGRQKEKCSTAVKQQWSTACGRIIREPMGLTDKRPCGGLAQATGAAACPGKKPFPPATGEAGRPQQAAREGSTREGGAAHLRVAEQMMRQDCGRNKTPCALRRMPGNRPFTASAGEPSLRRARPIQRKQACFSPVGFRGARSALCGRRACRTGRGPWPAAEKRQLARLCAQLAQKRLPRPLPRAYDGAEGGRRHENRHRTEQRLCGDNHHHPLCRAEPRGNGAAGAAAHI